MRPDSGTVSARRRRRRADTVPELGRTFSRQHVLLATLPQSIWQTIAVIRQGLVSTKKKRPYRFARKGSIIGKCRTAGWRRVTPGTYPSLPPARLHPAAWMSRRTPGVDLIAVDPSITLPRNSEKTWRAPVFC